MATSIKSRTWEMLDDATPGDKPSEYFDLFIISLVFLNIIAVAVESVASLQEQYENVFFLFELFSVVVFTLEYVGRVWSCTCTEEYKNPLTGRIRFILTPLSLADLIAILPFFLPFLGADLRSVRALRLLRLLRVLKIGRYSRSFRLFTTVFSKKKHELILTTFLAFLMLIISSTLMFHAEHHAQPDQFPDIPSTMWWAMATLTTIGYGDVVPITAFGRILASFVAVLGIGFIALPTSILGSAFVTELQGQTKEQDILCPHCQKKFKP